MELDIIKSQTTWNDASQSINLNFAKIRQALASIGSGGGTVDALISTVYDISKFGSISTNDNSATFNAFAIDSLYKRIKILEDEEVDFTGYATEQWVLNKSYITAVALSPYLKTSDANSTFATLVAFNALSSKTSALEGGLEALQGNHSDLSNEVESLDDNLGTLSSNFNTLKGRFDALDGALNDDVSGKINTWNEIVDFLNEYNGSKDLATILSGMNADIALRLKTADFDAWKTDVYSPLASRVSTAEGNIGTHTTQISGLTTRMGNAETNISTNAKGIADNKTAIATNKSNISANATAITNLGKRVTANEGNIAEILKWFAVDSDGNLYTTYNLYSTKEISANGLSIGSGGGGGGVISQVYGTTAFGTIASESNSATFNAYAIDSLYKRIVSLEGKATAVSFVPTLTSGKQIGTISIDGVSTVLYGVDAYSKTEADERYLKLTGGTITGSLNVLHNSSVIPLLVENKAQNYTAIAFRGANSNTAYLVYSGTGDTWEVTNVNWTRTSALLHANNYSQYALPLSGGKVSGEVKINGKSTLAAPLIIETPSMGYSGYIQFTDGSTELGWLGFSNKVAVIRQGGANSTIIHSGNYNSYSPKLDGTGASGTWGISISGNAKTLKTSAYPVINANEVSYTDCAVRFLSAIANTSTNLPTSTGYQNGMLVLPLHDNGSTAQMYFSKGDEHFYYRSLHTGAWKTIAFTDSNITGNAATATKLATARTIWGQSFDGSGNVSGNITLGAASIRGYDNRNILESTANDLMIGYGYTTSSLKTTIFGNTIKLNDAVLINSSGNVTIGSSDTAGTSYKLDVNGNIKGVNIFVAENKGMWLGSQFTASLTSDDLAIVGSKVWFFGDVSARNNLETRGTFAASGAATFGSTLSVANALTVATNVQIPINGDRITFCSATGTYTKGILAMNTSNTYLEAPLATDSASGAKPAIMIGWRGCSAATGTTKPYPITITSGEIALNGTTAINGTLKNVNNIYPNSAGERYIGTSTNPFKYMYAEWYGAGTGQTLSFGANNATHIWVDTSGRVGIGTYDPQYKLDVNGTARVTGAVTLDSTLAVKNILRVNDASMNAILNIANEGGTINYVHLFVSSANSSNTTTRPLVLQNGYGNVGIGINDPQYKLHVNGTARVSGDVSMGSTLNVTGAVTMSSTLHVVGVSNFESYLNIQAGIRPNVDNARYVGTSSYRFNEGYINNMYTNAVYVGKGTTYGFVSDGSITATTIYAKSGIKISSGQALTFLDASGKEHKLTYDSTAGAFKFDGNILVTGDGQFNAIN